MVAATAYRTKRREMEKKKSQRKEKTEGNKQTYYFLSNWIFWSWSLSAVQEIPEKRKEATKKSPLLRVVRPVKVEAFTVSSSNIYVMMMAGWFSVPCEISKY